MGRERGSERASRNERTPAGRSPRPPASVGRREYLRLVGAGGLATAGVLAGTGSAAADPEYTTYTVASGETFRRDIDSEGTFENVLIDATAPDTDVRIDASGSNWEIRNVGIKGRLDSTDTSAFRLQVTDGSTGVFENVYLGDGATEGGHGGVFVPTSHEGVLRVRELNVQYWADNGEYASAPGRSERSGRGGRVDIARSYARNNNIAGFRIGTDRSVVRDSVVHVDGDVPDNARGQENARGIWVKEGGSVRIENCDVLLAHPDGSHCIVEGDDNSVSFARVIDSEIAARDGADGRYSGNVGTENVGSDPNVARPPGVPASAKEAAIGRDFSKSIDLAGGSGADRLTYALETTGEVAATRSTEGADRVSGGEASGISTGAPDIYRYIGRVTTLDASIPENGSVVSVAIDRSDGRIRFATGSRNGDRYEYYLRVSGSLESTGNIEGSDVASGTEAKGYLVGQNNTDTYGYAGEIEALRIAVPDDGSLLSVAIETAD